MYSTAGDYARAGEYCRRSLAIFEKVVGPYHYYTSYPVSLLGGIEKMEGKFDEAEAAFKRAIAIKEKLQGPYHPDLGSALTNLANLYMAMGETEKAIAAQTRANEILEFNTTLNLSVGSERQKLGYLQTLSFNQDQTLTLSLRIANKNQKAADLAMTTVLRRKGRVLDAVSDSMVALRNRLDDRAG
jgi:tetratricopeptide (TPR) repeat protein